MLQEYYTDNNGSLRPGRRGINLQNAEFHSLSLVIPQLQADADKLFDQPDDKEEEEEPQRIPTVVGKRIATVNNPTVGRWKRLALQTNNKKEEKGWVPSTPTKTDSVGLATDGSWKRPTTLNTSSPSEMGGEDYLAKYMSKPQNTWTSYTPTYSPS